MISSLSMPITGRSTGMSQASLVQAMAWMVWLATWPTLSPVISASHSFWRATRQAIFIMYRRMMMVNRSSGHWSRMASWISVKGTMCSLMRPQ